MIASEYTPSTVIESLLDRASVRRFKDRPIPPLLLDNLLAAAVRAPTSFNFQAYSLIVSTAPERRGVLSELTGQRQVAEAPVVVVVCADMDRVRRLGERFAEPQRLESDELTLTSVIDASLVGMCLALAAESMGLGTVMVGAVRNRPEQVAKHLELPGGVLALFAICLGWPEESPAARPRLRADIVGHPERYDPNRAELCLDFDESTMLNGNGPPRSQAIIEWQQQIETGLKRTRKRPSKVFHDIPRPANT